MPPRGAVRVRPRRGATVWFTGLSGAGKTTIAAQLHDRLARAGRAVYLLDGDGLRAGLNSDLGFSDADRHESVRRAGEVAALFADAGLVVLVALISPFEAGRRRARLAHEDIGVAFHEVFVDTPLPVCETRDPKGLYRAARRGELRAFTGISSPYERPRTPDLTVVPSDGTPARIAEAIHSKLAL
ncbi:adenylyl-sulfate kinase [Nocardia abscessus]|uniref:adenylyl-sulfate kinase n=1 Tax=Nocardia abscessus TaxID=120957 RepID=UPI0005B9AEA8|nr:adenylyl-sulfate kinase [Nocardia abscessus]